MFSSPGRNINGSVCVDKWIPDRKIVKETEEMLEGGRGLPVTSISFRLSNIIFLFSSRFIPQKVSWTYNIYGRLSDKPLRKWLVHNFNFNLLLFLFFDVGEGGGGRRFSHLIQSPLL